MLYIVNDSVGNELFKFGIGNVSGEDITEAEFFTLEINTRIKENNLGNFSVTVKQVENMLKSKEQKGNITIFTLPNLCSTD